MVELTRDWREFLSLLISHRVKYLVVGGHAVATSISPPNEPCATALDITDLEIVVHLLDGRVLHVPLEWFPRLRDASPEQRLNFRFMGNGLGIHWPDIDEDLSVRGLLTPPASARQTAS